MTTGLTIASAALAQSTGFPGADSSFSSEFSKLTKAVNALPTAIASGISKSFTTLEQQLKTYYTDSWKQVTKLNTTPIPHLNSLAATNTATTTVNKQTVPVTSAASTQAQISTQDNLDNSLRQYVYVMNHSESDSNTFATPLYAKGQLTKKWQSHAI